LRIIIEEPPNIVAIRNTFPLTGREIFAWGDTIYNPSNAKLTKELRAHEAIHSQQQSDDIEGWWAQYLKDVDFRFKQEVEAHIVEYITHRRVQRSRNIRRIYLREISKRLSSPMYGSIVTFDKAKKLIKGGLIEST